MPSKTPGHDGWLLLTVDHVIDETRHESELLVVDATDIAKGPIARVKMPVPLHPQVHGWWVSGTELAKSRHKDKAA